MSSATVTKPGKSVNVPADGKSPERRVKQTREQRGLPPLTAAQTIAKQLVQQAQNSCRFIKDSIDAGKMPKADVLQACSVLSGALAGMLGEE